MVTEQEGEGAFGERCLIAAAADARACWEEYITLVYAAAEGGSQDGATRRTELCEELHRARSALITATTVRRLALDEIDAERDDDDEDDEPL